MIGSFIISAPKYYTPRPVFYLQTFLNLPQPCDTIEKDSAAPDKNYECPSLSLCLFRPQVRRLSHTLHICDSPCLYLANMHKFYFIYRLTGNYFLLSKIPLAQPADRSSSPSFSGPSLPFTKKPSGEATRVPPFPFRLPAIFPAA